ncbi:16S rRNA (uracil(1498)-N(3))-methyltransferase [Helicobacter pylori]|nr:16S rRNA (uracil(1498)-N(3))-methyltransferase [Helicobacter pylori]MCQ2842751.1 16S rRNA (uracil(1498)-N(3))-methyltransferase [Helicobacter pylori]MCQ2847697.1 16S rRNA (uracil(1498)-N(3))-methyltransferase [Helicobacter pylori]MCQ2852792.1 16S rRNA (uracil(1498)-N(3))-methyltransferase [Helicobacter pylori]MCQ2885581.1 16S rRNA (uracil(1498)-N(3))-methyltransferase [Helicobacter pylori]
MRFVYHPLAKEPTLKIEGESYIHLYRSRRIKSASRLDLRNLKDGFLYTYEHAEITKKHALLRLVGAQPLEVIASKKTHLILSVIEIKSIEKILPFLNQLGVSKLSLFYADFSQRNEKIDSAKLERFQKILIHSCEQCGRSALMELEAFSNTKGVLNAYPKASVLDFNGKALQTNFSAEKGVIIGPEGGFSEQERGYFKEREIYRIPLDMVLKSESACVFVASITQI